jgi:ubiquinone/menaquinone biosynthesis C-methylase UbiE
MALRIIRAIYRVFRYKCLRCLGLIFTGVKNEFLNVANRIVVILYRLKYYLKPRKKQSYYNVDVNIQHIFKSFSQILNDVKEQRLPLFLGAMDGHLSCGLHLIRLISDSNWNDIVFKRKFIYGPSEIQTFFRSSFGLFLENKLKAIPYIYNIQLLRVFKGDNESCIIKGFESVIDKRDLGFSGFLVLSCGEDDEMENGKFRVMAHEDAANTVLRNGDVIKLDGNLGTVKLDPSHDQIDLLFFNAIPSSNDVIRVQQPGLDTIGPKKIWSPKVKMVPEILISNKDHLLRPSREGIGGLNLGGGSTVMDDWVSIDTRYGYEDVKNIYPLWLTDKSKLPFEDGVFSFVYSAHFLEHVDDGIAENIFHESFRVLKPNGTIMIAVPNFQKALEHYRMGSWEFATQWGFSSPLMPIYSMNGREVNIENITAAMFTASTSIASTNGGSPAAKYIFNGVPYVPLSELKMKLSTLDVKEFSKFMRSKLPEYADSVEHVNAYTKEELEAKLSRAGFTVVSPTSEELVPMKENFKKNGYYNKWDSVSLIVAGMKEVRCSSNTKAQSV